MVTNIGRKNFNKLFEETPIIQYTRNGKVHSVYKRISEVPDGFDAYSVFTYTWISKNNILNKDFEIYDNLEDMKANKSKWIYCNYDDTDVGYPRDCGKSQTVDWQWFSLPGGAWNAPGLTNGSSFQLFEGLIHCFI